MPILNGPPSRVAVPAISIDFSGLDAHDYLTTASAYGLTLLNAAGALANAEVAGTAGSRYLWMKHDAVTTTEYNGTDTDGPQFILTQLLAGPNNYEKLENVRVVLTIVAGGGADVYGTANEGLYWGVGSDAGNVSGAAAATTSFFCRVGADGAGAAEAGLGTIFAGALTDLGTVAAGASTDLEYTFRYRHLNSIYGRVTSTGAHDPNTKTGTASSAGRVPHNVSATGNPGTQAFVGIFATATAAEWKISKIDVYTDALGTLWP